MPATSLGAALGAAAGSGDVGVCSWWALWSGKPFISNIIGLVIGAPKNPANTVEEPWFGEERPSLTNNAKKMLLTLALAWS